MPETGPPSVVLDREERLDAPRVVLESDVPPSVVLDRDPGNVDNDIESCDDPGRGSQFVLFGVGGKYG